MEIRFSHVEVGNQKDLCFVLPNESISAIAGEGKEEVLKLIGEEFPSKGNIEIEVIEEIQIRLLKIYNTFG